MDLEMLAILGHRLELRLRVQLGASLLQFCNYLLDVLRHHSDDGDG